MSDNKAMLFDNFCYGMAKSEVNSLVEGQPCADAPENSLLLCSVHPVEFLNTRWNERFWFNNLQELQELILEHEADANASAVFIMDELLHSDWMPVYAETEDNAFDLLEVSKKHNPEIAEKSFKEFCTKNLEKGLLMTIYYFPQEFVNKIMGKVKSRTKAIDEKATENFVQLGMTINAGKISLSFTAPLLSRKNALRYGQFIKR